MLICKHLGSRFSAWTRRSITMAELSQEDEKYKKTVAALNNLRRILPVVRQKKQAEKRQSILTREFNMMYQYLERTGLKVEDLDRMNAIHIAGTKGKGSVCVMTESILRAHGLKTGFFSSPHLLEERERIRINGLPLSKMQFVSYFWDCHNKLSFSKEQYRGTMPTIFQFLSVMAFSVFLQEKVDVAVVEVGIGGEYDSTNVLVNPLVTAITLIDYHHVDILGDSLAEIAWQKGGIFKPGHPAFTIPQSAESLKMLSKRARELKVSSFHVVPNMSEYLGELPELGLPGDHQQINASLAAQVCKAWLQEKEMWRKMNVKANSVERSMEGVPVADPLHLPPEFHKGLKSCHWLGRNQIIKHPGITYFLDGAATPNSMKACAEWFVKAACKESQTIEGSVARVLMFNLTEMRDNRALIQPLMRCGLQYAIFCPYIADINSTDQTNLMEKQITQSKAVAQTWLQLHSEKQLLFSSAKQNKQNGLGGHVALPGTSVFSYVNDALHWVTSGHNPSLTALQREIISLHPPSSDITKATHIQLLVTGSLKLVGTVLSVMGYTADDVS